MNDTEKKNTVQTAYPDVLTDIDDAMISEAISTPRKRRFPAAVSIGIACAAAAVILSIVLSSPHREQYAMNTSPEPTSAPTAQTAPTETAAPAATDGPMESEPPPATAEPTPEVTAEPRVTPKATCTPKPTATAGATVRPKPTSAGTPTPRPTDTAAPTNAGPVTTADPTPEATLTPAPTSQVSDPPEYLVFGSVESFVTAVQSHSDPLLEGIEEYYLPDTMPQGQHIDRIIVWEDSVQLRFKGAGTQSSFQWYRHRGADELAEIAASEPGEWYGDLYLLDMTSSIPYYRAYWAQYGKLFFAALDSGYDLDTVEAFCGAVEYPIGRKKGDIHENTSFYGIIAACRALPFGLCGRAAGADIRGKR